METVQAEFYTLSHNGLDYVIEILNGTTYVFAIRNGYQVCMNDLLTDAELTWIVAKAQEGAV